MSILKARAPLPAARESEPTVWVTMDATLARELAVGAGEMLMAFRQSKEASGLGYEQLKAEGDGRAQAFLSEALSRRRPGDYVLSEEAGDDRARLLAERVWIIDPLDGTREYAEGRSDWAVHVALWSRGALSAGAVALPALSYVSGGDVPLRTWNPSKHLRIAVSRSRAPEVAHAVAQRLNAQLQAMGSAGYKTCAVIRGEADVYLHAGGQFEWDSAAPVFAALEAGLHASRLDGSKLRYNQRSVYLPDLLICRPEVRDELLTVVKEVRTPARRGTLPDMRAGL